MFNDFLWYFNINLSQIVSRVSYGRGDKKKLKNFNLILYCIMYIYGVSPFYFFLHINSI